MKISRNIDDGVVAQLERESARQGRTISELVERALRNFFRNSDALAPLPSFRSDGALVDVADRDSVSEAMEGR